MQLEFKDDVWSYETQPFTVRLVIAERREKYTIDILVELLNGTFRLEEIKYAEAVDERVNAKLDALRTGLDSSIFEVELINADFYPTSVEIANFEFLYRYLRHPPQLDTTQLNAISDVLGNAAQRFGDVARLLEGKLGIEIATSWWLVGVGRLTTDLLQPLSIDSLVRWIGDYE